MTKKNKSDKSTLSKDDRLKAALKANMAKRKAQARVRGAAHDASLVQSGETNETGKA